MVYSQTQTSLLSTRNKHYTKYLWQYLCFDEKNTFGAVWFLNTAVLARRTVKILLQITNGGNQYVYHMHR